jgi:hypothetical protein
MPINHDEDPAMGFASLTPSYLGLGAAMPITSVGWAERSDAHQPRHAMGFAALTPSYGPKANRLALPRMPRTLVASKRDATPLKRRAAPAAPGTGAAAAGVRPAPPTFAPAPRRLPRAGHVPISAHHHPHAAAPEPRCTPAACPLAQASIRRAPSERRPTRPQPRQGSASARCRQQSAAARRFLTILGTAQARKILGRRGRNPPAIAPRRMG